MDDRLIGIARTCLDAAERDTMTFPEIVGALMQAGFESYEVDYRRGTATYFLPDADSVVLPKAHASGTVAATLDAGALQATIREAQQLVPGYTYAGFSKKPRPAARATSSRSAAGACSITAARRRLTPSGFRIRCAITGT